MKKYLLVHRDPYAFSGGYSVEEFDSPSGIVDYLFAHKVGDYIVAQRVGVKVEIADWQSPAVSGAAEPVAAAEAPALAA